MIFTGLTITFLKHFGIGLWLTFPLLVSLAPAITLLGQVVGTGEGWSRFDNSIRRLSPLLPFDMAILGP